MSFPPSTPRPTGDTPVDKAMAGAREMAVEFSSRDIPVGCEGDVLDQFQRLNGEIERIRYGMLPTLARMEAAGTLLEEGGQRTVKAWITHHWKTDSTNAGRLAHLARALYTREMPNLDAAFHADLFSLDEAAKAATEITTTTQAWAKVVEQGGEEFRATHMDPKGYRARMEVGLVTFKEERPQASVSQLGQAAQVIAAYLDPDKADRDYDEAFETRGLKLSKTFNGGYQLSAWGPAADAEILDAVLEAFEQPHGPDNSILAKHERGYDAFLSAVETGAAHRRCGETAQPWATMNITVPLTSLLGDPEGEPATSGNGVVIPQQMLDRLLPHSWLRRFLTDPKGKTILDVGRRNRCATDPIQGAASFKQDRCAWSEGCDVPLKWSQFDHIVPFSQGGATSADNMQVLCPTHNRLKHRWQTKINRRIWADHYTRMRRQTPQADGGEDGEGDPVPATAL